MKLQNKLWIKLISVLSNYGIVWAGNDEITRKCLENQHVEAFLDGKIIIHCPANVTDKPSWVKNGEKFVDVAKNGQIMISERRFTLAHRESNFSGFDLQISSLKRSDENLYCCDFVYMSTLPLHCCTHLHLADLTIQADNGVIYGTEGQNISVPCFLSRQIQDVHLIISLNNSKGASGKENNVSLSMTLSKSHNGQTITCSAFIQNSTMYTETIVQLNVSYTPEVQINLSAEETFYEGGNVSLKCSYDSNPEPTIVTWSKDGKFLSNGAHLKLNNITKHTAGVYKCKANNGIGFGEAEVQVKLRYAPHTPLSVSVKPLCCGFQLCWIPNNNGGLQQSFYISYRKTNSKEWIITGPLYNVVCYQVCGLSTDTLYDVKMFAVNAIGKSNSTVVRQVETLNTGSQCQKGLIIYLLSTSLLTVFLLTCTFLYPKTKHLVITTKPNGE